MGPDARLARAFGATDIVTERGHAGVARMKGLTNGLGAHSVIEAIGTQESMLQAICSNGLGDHVGYVVVALWPDAVVKVHHATREAAFGQQLEREADLGRESRRAASHDNGHDEQVTLIDQSGVFVKQKGGLRQV